MGDTVTVGQAAGQVGRDEYFIRRLVEIGRLEPVSVEPLLFDRGDVERLAEYQHQSDENMRLFYETSDELNYIEERWPETKGGGTHVGR